MPQIRLARLEDVDAVLDVGRETWHATYVPLAGEQYVEEKLAAWWTRDGISAATARGLVWVAEDDEEILAMSMCGFDSETIEVWKLYVRPAHQRRGLGADLVKAALAAHPTARRIVLAYMDGNESAEAFYRRNGFVETHRDADPGYPDCIWMARELDVGK